MLVPFVIDADSLVPDPSWAPAQCRACHKSLLDVWRQFGLLTHDGEKFEQSRLRQAVQELPQALRSLWQEALERVPLCACSEKWDGSVTPENLGSIRASAALALVDDTRAEAEFGLSEGLDQKMLPVNGASDVEICRLLAANQASAFKKAQSLSGVHIEAQEAFQEIWDARFQMLALAPIKRVVIVDRYAISQQFECPQTTISGLARFLRLLDMHARGPRHVTLFAGWTQEINQKAMPDVEQELREVMSRLAHHRINELNVVMLPNAVFRESAHDRFIRFDKYVWDVGIGLKIFEGAYAPERSSATFKSGDAVDGYRAAERTLRAHKNARSATIRV